MTQPSKFIFNTDYATSQNDAIKKFTVVIPASFSVYSTPYYVVNQEFSVGTKAAGMRIVVKSSKYSDILINPTSFDIPATYYSQYLQEYSESALLANIVRSAPGKVRIRVIPSLGAVYQAGDSFSNCGQTLTISVETFLSPFEQ
jgi:hypothetical protein